MSGPGESGLHKMAWGMVALGALILIAMVAGCGAGAAAASRDAAAAVDASEQQLGGGPCAFDGGYGCAEAVRCVATCDRPGDAGLACRTTCERCLDNSERGKEGALASCLENACAVELDLWEHQLELHRDCSILAKRPAGPRGGGQCAAEWTACFP